jgi:signal peptidase I
LICAIALPIGRVSLIGLALCALAFPLYSAIDAFVIARRNRHAPLKKYQRWWVYVLFFFVFGLGGNAVALFARAFVGEAFVIPTRGMAPTILAGDRILVDKLWYRVDQLQRNDVVVFSSDGPDSPLFVQRIVGLPGDEIEIKDEQLIVNGEPWDDPHAAFTGPLPPLDNLTNYGPTKVPADSFFLLGDNRRLSKDSRVIGPIPSSEIYGVARIIYMSRERMFPDPDDTSDYELGPFRWDRFGLRID